MKKVKPFDKDKVPEVHIDPELEKYHGKVLFPESLARANKMLKNAKLPPRQQSE